MAGVEETGEEEAWEESAGQENSQDEEEQEDYTTRLFIHCLLKANWQEKAWKGESNPGRGQFVTSLSKLAEETGLTIRQTRTAAFPPRKDRGIDKPNKRQTPHYYCK